MKKKFDNLTLSRIKIASLNNLKRLIGGTNYETTNNNTNTFTASDDAKKCKFTYTCKNCTPIIHSKNNCAH